MPEPSQVAPSGNGRPGQSFKPDSSALPCKRTWLGIRRSPTAPSLAILGRKPEHAERRQVERGRPRLAVPAVSSAAIPPGLPTPQPP